MRREVAGALDRRPAGDAQRRAELGRDDHGQGGLAEAGRPGQQHVVRRPAARRSALSRTRASCSRTRACPMNSSRRLGRSAASTTCSSRVGDGETRSLVVALTRPVGAHAGSALRMASSQQGGDVGGVAAGARSRLGRPRRRPRRPRGRSSRGRPAPRAPGRARRRRARPCTRPRAERVDGAPSLSFSSSTMRWAPFLPMPGTCVSAARPRWRRRGAARRAGARRASPGRAGADAAGGLQQLEDRALVVVGEAVQGEGVLADDQRGGQPGRLADPQAGQRGRRALHRPGRLRRPRPRRRPAPTAATLPCTNGDHCAPRLAAVAAVGHRASRRLERPARRRARHGRSPAPARRRRRPGGAARSRSSRVTMLATWALSARPLPVTAAFTSLGVCSATGRPAPRGARRWRSPPACAVPITVRTLCWLNTRSTATASGGAGDPALVQAALEPRAAGRRCRRRPGCG